MSCVYHELMHKQRVFERKFVSPGKSRLDVGGRASGDPAAGVDAARGVRLDLLVS